MPASRSTRSASRRCASRCGATARTSTTSSARSTRPSSSSDGLADLALRCRSVAVVPHLGRLGRADALAPRQGPTARVGAPRRLRPRAREHDARPSTRRAPPAPTASSSTSGFDADDTVVVFHDSALERLTGRPGTMEATLAAEREAAARQRRAGADARGGARRHRRSRSTSRSSRNKTGRERELAKATAKVIKDHGAVDRVIVSSFDPVRPRPAPLLPARGRARGPVPRRPADTRCVTAGSARGSARASSTRSTRSCTEASVARWHRAGLPINVWTVDDETELRRLAVLGVDGVIANDPGHALAVLTPE